MGWFNHQLDLYNHKSSWEVIGDHDIALSYVLERCPEALPSFAGLLPELQEPKKRKQWEIGPTFLLGIGS